MSYEHNFDGKIVVFPDEENYLKCKLQYLEYEKGFGEDEDHLSFEGYIDANCVTGSMTNWTIEGMQDNATQTQIYTFSIDMANDGSTDTWSRTSYTNTVSDPFGDNELQTITGPDEEILYTTLVPNSSNVTDLKNGWIRTDSVYRSSTDTPEEKEKKRMKNDIDRFDI